LVLIKQFKLIGIVLLYNCYILNHYLELILEIIKNKYKGKINIFKTLLKLLCFYVFMFFSGTPQLKYIIT